jgi:hypothetical protein
MIMGGTAGMNMNGADASAAAGLNTTKANWDYTGPALPTALAQELLADGKNGPDQIHMAATGCASEPTFSQEINATQYVQATSETVAPYADPAAAVAAGYMAVSPTTYPVVYYVNPAIEAANAAAKRTLSPAHVDGLVYAQIPSGQEVLAAAMYVLPADAVRGTGAVAPADRCLRAAHRIADHPEHHRHHAVCHELGAKAHALPHHGVAGPGGRRSHGDPASGHPDSGSGDHAGCHLRMSLLRPVHPRGGWTGSSGLP